MTDEKPKPPAHSISTVKLRMSKLKWKKSEGDGKPSGSTFSQQELRYWQPILVPRVILPLYFIFGVLFLILGTILYLVATEFPDIVLDYTNCDILASENFTHHGEEFNSYWKFNNATQKCTFRFDVPVDLDQKVLLMYQITNLFQNYRRYVQSRSSDQLLGKPVTLTDISDCAPLVNIIRNETGSEISYPMYYPCGLIANSMFNDTFFNLTNHNGESFEFSEKGIAWVSELDKFKKTTLQPNENGIFTNIIPPPDWSAYNGTYTVDNLPDISQDEHFIVWMRCASSSSFRKIYGQTNSTLRAGTWEVDIKSQYVVRQFKGTKALVIHRETWLAGHSSFIGMAYVAVGGCMLLMGVFLLSWHLLRPRRFGDASLLSWNSEPR